jgi:hypothetical protein
MPWHAVPEWECPQCWPVLQLMHAAKVHLVQHSTRDNTDQSRAALQPTEASPCASTPLTIHGIYMSLPKCALHQQT